MRPLSYALVAAGLLACGNTSTTATQQAGNPPPPSVAPVAAGCDPAVPAAACHKARGCKPGEVRTGEWRYVIAAPPYGNVEDITSAELAAIWKGEHAVSLAGTEETAAVLGAYWGPGKLAPIASPPVVDDTHWIIVPAHEPTLHFKLVTVDGVHPLDKAPGPLAVPLCGADTAVRNIDPDKLTILAMTGTTALTRHTARLMEDKGILYPLPAIEPWLAAADLVHVSNEVSFLPRCDAGQPGMKFCSKDSYIELLEKSHTRIVELTGSHLIDYGRKWLEKSIDMYEQRGWVWFGGGRDQLDAITPRIVEHNGNKLAFLGCNKPYTDKQVLDRGAGVAACDLPRMQWQIRDLRRRGFVPIVSVQHEEVYRHDPPAALVGDLRALADAGPSYVMGSQAHCPHPWEVHRGVYVHYGPGNLYFDQFWHPVRDAAHDKLYIHAGTLLAVGHMYTRTEERGRPRLLDTDERGELLADLAGAQRRLPAGADPWGKPIDVPVTRERPDSVVADGTMHQLVITLPARLDPAAKYPALVQLAGDRATDDTAVVVTRIMPEKAKDEPPRDELAAAIADLLVARYPVDRARITFEPPPPVATKKPRKPRKK